jgi:pimeloyl-ACP methyl ester carboxylesterase
METTARRAAPRSGPGGRHVVAVAVALTLLLGAAGVSPAAARTDDRSKPVLLVHGYNATSSSTSCGANFDTMIAQLRSQGFTGPMVRVGFYSGDYNCDVNLRSYGSFSDSSSWKQIAKALSHYVSREYTSRGVAVDIVGYSMGGLIGRGAVWGSQKAESGFAPASTSRTSSPSGRRTTGRPGTPRSACGGSAPRSSRARPTWRG